VALFPLRRPERGRKPTGAITVERRFRLNGTSVTAARAVVELASLYAKPEMSFPNEIIVAGKISAKATKIAAELGGNAQAMPLAGTRGYF
jgi:hypothetical protein